MAASADLQYERSCSSRAMTVHRSKRLLLLDHVSNCLPRPGDQGGKEDDAAHRRKRGHKRDRDPSQGTADDHRGLGTQLRRRGSNHPRVT